MENTSARRITNIYVFFGSISRSNQEFVEATIEFSKVLAERKIHLVYEGGNLRFIGSTLKAIEGGSKVLGIIPKTLVDKNLTEKSNEEKYCFRYVQQAH